MDCVRCQLSASRHYSLQGDKEKLRNCSYCAKSPAPANMKLHITPGMHSVAYLQSQLTAMSLLHL